LPCSGSKRLLGASRRILANPIRADQSLPGALAESFELVISYGTPRERFALPIEKTTRRMPATHRRNRMKRLLAGIALVLAASSARAQCAPRGDLGNIAQAGRSLTATFDLSAGSCIVDGTFLDSYTFTGT